MKKASPRITAALIMTVGLMLAFQITPRADITGSHPGHPGTWEGLTTNTTIVITLDTPVAMVGNPLEPDITYCVKKAELSGLDFVFTDVPCTVEVSADRKIITLYPNDVLEENGMYAYKVESINFDDTSSAQDFAKYFASGDNPLPAFALEVEEADMCIDEGGAYWCVRCHKEFVDANPAYFGGCVITP